MEGPDSSQSDIVVGGEPRYNVSVHIIRFAIVEGSGEQQTSNTQTFTTIPFVPRPSLRICTVGRPSYTHEHPTIIVVWQDRSSQEVEVRRSKDSYFYYP
ncbi:hypothetical protein GOBAR_AA04129 [Gossypium barbadense]|uniref:Uncharacterized protein n=1 Tax=Gossypium barbadense TaxID=3634 RepID=A0A2P5YLE4_GOSBA|nr:hypothetical protein GOBAR_AA04129 [Gossypium barbadense]